VAVQASHLNYPDANYKGDACFDGASARQERDREGRAPVASVPLSIVVVVPQQVVLAAGPDRRKEPSSQRENASTC
jgi:hypothetical protein